jgi:peptidoglycan/LPS O-acetylase OafA/YrhL
MQSSSGIYLSKVDHLRFVAAALVVWWHFDTHPRSMLDAGWFWPLSMLTQGYTGVSLFMVLSGFIFTVICYGKPIVYSRFIYNRFLRVGPLAIIWTLFYYLGEPVTGSASELFFSFFVLLNRGTLPDIGWSIVVEFQFYVVFPFVILFIHKAGIRYLFMAIAIFAAFRWFQFSKTGSVQLFAYSTIFGRIDQFLVGILAGIIFLRCRDWSCKAAPVLLAGSVVALIGYMYIYDSIGGFMGIEGSPSRSALWIFQQTIEACLYAGIILGWTALSLNLPGPIDRLFAGLGNISYSIYWSHITIILAVRANLALFAPDTPVWLSLLLCLVVIGLFSWLTYHAIERPFLRLRLPYLREEKVASSAT